MYQGGDVIKFLLQFLNFQVHSILATPLAIFFLI